MKKFFFIVILLLMIPIMAKSQWRFVRDFGAQLDRITSLHFLDLPGPPRIGFLGINDPAQLWKTTNGGSTWYQVGTSNDAVLFAAGPYDFTFKDSLTGWMATYGPNGYGGCYKTTDCGETWNPIAMPYPSNPSFSIYYHKATNRLFVALDGDWYNLVSTDEGASWQSMNTYFDCCSFSEDSIGIFLTHPLSFTTDGGKTWTQSNNSPPVFCYHPLAIWGTKTFFVTGDSNKIYRSDDGGKNWMFVSVLPGSLFYGSPSYFGKVSSVLYGDLQHIYTQTIDGVFVSIDEGVSWQSICGPGNYMNGGGNPIGFYARDNYIYASIWNDGYGHPTLYVNSTGLPFGPRLVFQSNTYTVKAGDSVTIPLRTPDSFYSGFTADSVSIQLDFDINAFALQSVSPSAGWSVSWLAQDSEGTIIHLVRSGVSVVADSQLLSATFKTYISANTSPTVALDEINWDQDVTFGDCMISSLSARDTAHIQINLACGDSLILAGMQGAPPFSIVSIQPNPASSSIEINLSRSSSSPIDYTLFDALGHSVLSGADVPSKLDVTSLPNGGYYIRLSCNSYVRTQKIVIER